MKMIWFQAFNAIAKYGSFSAAAEELYTSQANISKYISLLEKELDVVLFDRRTRNARLTSEGAMVLSHSRAIEGELKSMRDSIAAYKNSAESIIKIASVPIVHLYDLSGVLVEFNNTHPDMQLEMIETDMRGVMNYLETEQNTIGIMRTCTLPLLSQSIKWKYSPFIEDELVLLCNRKVPIAAAENISLSDCMKEKMMILSTGYTEYKILLENYGIPTENFTPFIKCASVATLKNYMDNNLGVSLITKGMARRLCVGGDLVIRSFTEEPKFSLSIVTQHTASREAVSLIRRMIEVNELRSGTPSGVRAGSLMI